MNDNNLDIKIGVIGPPMTKANVNQYQHIISVLKAVSKRLHVISVENLTKGTINYDESIYRIQHKTNRSFFKKVCNYAFIQLKISKQIFNNRKEVDVWFFFMGEYLILPLITAKICKKKTIFLLGGSSVTQSITQKILYTFRKLNFYLSDMILLYSYIFINKWNLENYTHKIEIAHEHYLDFTEFKVLQKYETRDYVIGYIGHLDESKGVLNFVKTIPEVLQYNSEIKFLICGEGPSKDEIYKYINEKQICDKVELIGWTPHEKIPLILNRLKLLVLPSKNEGLPNIVLEAMACGTPVLVTPVGAIPDYITNGVNGFLLENSSEECIAKNIIKIIQISNLDEISKISKTFVNKEFSYNKTVEILKSVMTKFENYNTR